MDSFIENYDILYNNEFGIKALKGKILDLAIRGKLVQQIDTEASAHSLLCAIAEVKAQTVRGKTAKVTEPVRPINESETSFDIPENWCWVRLESISEYIQRGKSPKYSEKKEIPVIAQKCIQREGVSLDKAQFIEPESLSSYTPERILKEGDILWNSTGTGSCGRVGVFHDGIRQGYETIVADSHVTVVRCMKKFVNYQYLFIWLSSPEVQSVIESKASGTTNQIELATSTIMEYLISLPPASEQIRIVAKVKELFELCDKIIIAMGERRLHHYKLPKAVVDAIGSSSTSEDLRRNLLFVLDNFKTIFQDADSMKELRNVVLQLAIEGKLVPQDESDEPASVLLKKIQGEKERLVREKKIKKSAPLAPVTEDEIPFEIPENWRWSRLGDISNYGNKDNVLPEKITPDVWVLELEDIEKDTSRILQMVCNNERCSKSNKTVFRAGDVLYGKLRPYLKKVIIAPADGVCTTEIFAFRGYCNIDPRYLVTVLKSTYFDEIVNGLTHGMSMPRLGTDEAKNIPLPLPPVQEQCRIVEKVDVIMQLIDQMENELKRKVDLVKKMVAVS